MKIWPWSRFEEMQESIDTAATLIAARDKTIRTLTDQNRKLVDQNQNLRLRVRIAENKIPPDFTSINSAP